MRPDLHALPLTPRRLALHVTPGNMCALTVYRPQTQRARLALAGGRTLLRAGVRGSASLAEANDVAGTLGAAATDSVAAFRSSAPGRLIVGIADTQLRLIAKVARVSDPRLHNEANFLKHVASSCLTFAVPAVLEWRVQDGVSSLVTAPVTSVGSAEPSLSCVMGIALELQSGRYGKPLVHGDFAPWNLLATADGPVLLDWESTSWRDAPAQDIVHWLVSSGGLLRRLTPWQAVRILEDSVVPLFSRELGVTPAAVRTDARRYLGELSCEPKYDRRAAFASSMGCFL